MVFDGNPKTTEFGIERTRGENVEFRELTDAEYQGFLDRQDRVYVSQLIEYGDAREGENVNVQRVGLVDDGKVLGAAMINEQPWMKLFKRSIAYFGPSVDFNDIEMATRFMEGLKNWVKRDPRVLSLRVNPYVIRRPYDGLTPGKDTEEARAFEEVMKRTGGVKVKGDYFRDGTSVAASYLYTKDLAGLDYKQAIASTGNNVRAGVRKAASNDIKIEYAEPSDESFKILRDILNHTAERTEMPEVDDIALVRSRRMMELMGPEKFLFPIAILDTKDTLATIDSEIVATESEIAKFEAMAEEGELSKKHANQLKQFQNQHGALLRRREKTLEVQETHGERVVLTASQFIETPTDMIFYHSGGYSDLADYRGIYAVHDAMIKRAIDRGLRWYNLNVIPGSFEEGEPGYGLVDYKSNFHGEVEELVGSYDFAIRPKLAKRLGAIDEE